MVINASRTGTLYEGTTGQSLSCVVTPDNTGVDTSTNLIRGVTGPADGDRVSISDTVNDGVATVEYSIGVLSLNDTGTYTCSASVSPVSSQYVVAASNTDTESITVEGESLKYTEINTLILYLFTALPDPVVTIMSSPSLPILAGTSLTLTCTVDMVDFLAVEPVLVWTRVDGQTLTGSLSGLTNTLSFDPVVTSNADQYTCTATVNVPVVNIIDRTGNNTVDLNVDSEYAYTHKHKHVISLFS